ncbi:uncharacterized protein RHOBADRAFT_52542 [Rhodotorula graminis WP1]|uniref:Uncharacterized protein n=1 Tax=Rhodotorula graminis (strain WP1) TaxID=578459 RepID=A0A194S7T6_RHOGW|nr:uncharacterized protein RHOBADRAFT_52542 [Rhodotorula graminis WP1]KPV76550.1 hypothetical protein RHOBADRAFT_52542 [Rhodotorula graminis WP1]
MAEPSSSRPELVDPLSAELLDLVWPAGDDWETFAQTVETIADYGVSLHARRAHEIRTWASAWTNRYVLAAWREQQVRRHSGTLERLRWLSFFMWAVPEGDLKEQLPAWQSVFRWTGAIKRDAWVCVERRQAALAAAAAPGPAAVQAVSPRHESPAPIAPPARPTFFLPPRYEATPDELAAGATGAIVLPDGTRHPCRGVPLGTALFGSSWQSPYWPQPRHLGLL